MSMLSSQIDHLCELADALDGRYGYQGYEIAMRDAADTILELRDDLQRANAAVQDAEHDESMAWDRIRNLEAENAELRERIDAAHMSRLLTENENESLRELVRWMYDRMDESCAVQHPYAPAPISYDRLMQALARVRELGVEVDE